MQIGIQRIWKVKKKINRSLILNWKTYFMDRFIFHNLNNIHVHASNMIFQQVGFIKVADVIFWHKAVREYNINWFFFHLKYCAHFNSHIIHRKHVLYFFLIYISIYLTILYQFHCISVPTHYTECARVPGHILCRMNGSKCL